MAKVLVGAGKAGGSVLLFAAVAGLAFYMVRISSFGQTEVVLVDGAPALEAEARELLEAGDLASAEAAYRLIADEYGGTQSACESLKQLAGIYLRTGSDEEAFAASKKLLEGYSESAGAAVVAFSVAEIHHLKGKFRQAHELYGDIISSGGDRSLVFQAMRGIILADVELAGDPNSGADIAGDVAGLVREYSGHAGFAREACLLADALCGRGEYNNAEYLYGQVILHHAEEEHALWSRKGLAVAALRAGKDKKAMDAVSALLAVYSPDERIANAARQIGDEFRKEKKHSLAKAVYGCVLREWPESEQALWSRMGSAISDIALGDDPNAAESVQRLLTDYSRDERLANAACQIGDMYQQSGRFEEARTLHGYVVDNWPGAEHGVWSQKGLAVTEVFDGSDSNSYPELDKLLANFRDHPVLPMAAFFAAEAHRDRAVSLRAEGRDAEAREAYARATGALIRTIRGAPPSIYTPESYYLLGECYSMSGSHAEALDCYRYVANTWPAWKLAWSARFQEGRAYDKLKKSGDMESGAAETGTRSAYRRLLSDHPDCPAAKAASGWLTRCTN